MMDYLRLFQGLDDAGIDYLVAGGLAVNFHGIPRMTYDVDLLVSLDPMNVGRMVKLLARWGYRPSIPVDPGDLADSEVRKKWRVEKNMMALSFRHQKNPIGEIDLLFDLPMAYEDLRKKALLLPLGKLTIPVISRDDLIFLKERSGRSQDVADAEALKRLVGKNGS